MKNTLIALVAISTVASFFAPVHAADKPILGLVTIDQTTESDFTKQVTAKGCYASKINGFTYQLNNGCIDLPGRPTVTVNFYTDTHQAYRVNLHYSKGETFAQYARSLKRSYGNPDSYQEPFVGNKYAFWTRKDVIVELSEPHMSFDGDLVYLSRHIWDRMQKERLETQKKKQKELDLL